MIDVIEKIEELLKINNQAIVAIDGRCGSGKTTFAKKLAEHFDAGVIHMDDFFLRKEQRSEERLKAPGENIDHERFLQEVLLPLKRGESFFYRPYICKSMDYGEKIYFENKAPVIIEGSYSCHKNLIDFYNLKIFLDIDKSTQTERIKARNGDMAEIFVTKWIPLEEDYFNTFKIREKCDFIKMNG